MLQSFFMREHVTKLYSTKLFWLLGKIKLRNVQISYDASWGRRDLLKSTESRHVGKEGVWPNRHITFIVAEKA